MMRKAISRLAEGRDLSREEAREAMRVMTAGEAGDAQVAALLMGLRVKGETAAELAGLAEGMREAALKVPLNGEEVADNCGTGGDGKGTFNISTAAAFIAAGAGARVAKHGNRAVSSRCGSADVLEALGINVELTPQQAARCLEETGMTFLFAPLFHPAMRHVMEARRQMGIPTAFNMLGPLANPAGAAFQVVGASSIRRASLIAGALAELGTRRALVVSGADGTDEFTTVTSNQVWEVREGGVISYLLDPGELGLRRAEPGDLSGGDAEENARVILSVLEGRDGPALDACLLNAAAVLLVCGLSPDLRSGLQRARDSVLEGKALEKLRMLRSFTAKCRNAEEAKEVSGA